MRCQSLLLRAAAVILSMCIAGPTSEAQAASGFPAGPVGAYMHDYVSALNDGDPAVSERFANVDLSPLFDQPHPPLAVRGFFESQRRITGGIKVVDFRFTNTAQTDGLLVFKDTIYGGLRAVEFAFDATPEKRITTFTFVSTPDWAIEPVKLTRDEVVAKAAARIERGCQADVFSGAFVVAYKGQVLLERACGEASKRYHAPNSLHTRFNLASMNKMFTAVAVVQLVERGRLALADRVSAYVDETWLPEPISSQITIGQLLSMTSGLEDYFSAAPLTSFQMNRTLEEYKPLIHGLKLTSPPGRTYAYSNTAYFLLGLVIQKASGEDYYDYIRKHIYVPAGMTATDSYPLDGPEPDLATGYVYRDETKTWIENRKWAQLQGMPSGGGYATAGDMVRFADALTSGKLVKSSSLEVLFRDHQPPSGTGFFVMDTPAGRIVGKDGLDAGVSTEEDIYLDAGWVVVSLSNYEEGARAPLEAMRADIAAAR